MPLFKVAQYNYIVSSFVWKSELLLQVQKRTDRFQVYQTMFEQLVYLS